MIEMNIHKVLVNKVPKCCGECPNSNYGGQMEGIHWYDCTIMREAHGYIEQSPSRPSWCPLELYIKE